MGQDCVVARKSLQDRHGIAQSSEELRNKDSFVGQFAEPGAERQQVSREIAAVHAGDVEREEWLERARLIPVVEVAAMPFESLHRGESGLRAANQAAGGEIAEVAGGKIREQGQPDVGGRRAGGDDGVGRFLKVVRRQPVFFFGNEGFKVVPGLARNESKEGRLFVGQRRSGRFDGLADPPRNPRSGEPGAKNWQRQGQLVQVGEHEEDGRPQRDERRDPHRGIEAGEIGAGVSFGITRGLPFEESLASHQQAQQRSANGVEADKCVVGQKGEGEKNLAELPST